MAYAVPKATSGVWTYITSVTASDDASVAITTGLTSTYKMMRIIGVGIQLVNGGGNALWMRCSTNGGSSYDSGNNYSYNQRYDGSDSSSDWNRSSADSKIIMIIPYGDSATSTNSNSFELDLFNVDNTSLNLTCIFNATANQGATNYASRGSGSYNVNAGVDAIQFLGATANIFVGDFYLYGLTV